jgi:threonine dehydrogenase-like Zn-dependent dehydrogenase
MRALFFDGRSVRLRQAYPETPPGDGEVLVKVHAAGICQTDLEIAKGYMHFSGVLGHEFVGTVARAGKGVDPAWLGKRVCGEINCICGACDMCARGLSSHCLRRTVIGILNHDGAFADILRLPARNLHALPDHVSDEEAVFVEPLAAAFQVLRQVMIEKKTRVTILGDGRLGQLVAQVLARTGCQLTLAGRHEEKLALAERLGNGRLRTALDGQLQNRRDQDVVIDCTGRAEGFARALELVRPRGTVVMKTTVAAEKPVNLAPIVIDEITVLGSRCGPFSDAIAALAGRQVQVLPLISRRVSLEQAEALFAPGAMPAALKIVIAIGGPRPAASS